MKLNTKNNAAFTLIELLAVIIIISALTVIAIPIFANRGTQIKATAHKENMNALKKQAQAYMLAQSSLPIAGTDITNELITNGYIKEIPQNIVVKNGTYKVTVNQDATVKVDSSPFIGKYIKFGRYTAENADTHEVTTTDIIWRVINKEDVNNDGIEEIMLLSDKSITIKAFDAKDPGDPRATNGSSFWLNSNIREWLNSNEEVVNYTTQKPDYAHVWADTGIPANPYDTEPGFLTNFTDRERNNIIEVKHKFIMDIDHDAPADGGNAEHINIDHFFTINEAVFGNNYNNAYFRYSTDKVFLLSLGELAQYVVGVLKHPASVRGYERAYATQQAIDQSDYGNDPVDDTTFFHYWTRDAHAHNPFSPRYVGVNGAVSYSHARNGYYGVRPSLFLNQIGLSVNFNDVTGDTPDQAYTVKWE